MYTKANLAALRVKKDIAELSRQRFNAAHASTSIDFPEGTRNLLKLKVGVSITSGLYEGATFYFLLTIPPSYPFHAPSVECTTRAWHPNIDLHTGFVSLPILAQDWRPVLSINCVVFALQLMFLEPVEEVAVNEAATAALANPDLFREQVRRTLAGGWMFGVQFEPHTPGSGRRREDAGTAPKRKRGEGMDTEAVQSTLQAMRIQGDEAAEGSPTWDKRPRHQNQPHYVLPLDQRQQHEAQTIGAASARHASVSASNGDFAVGPGFVLGVQHAPQQIPPRRQQQGMNTAFTHGSSFVGGSETAFDCLRFHARGEMESSAVAAGLRCGAVGTQAAVPQAARTGVVVPDAAGEATVGWGRTCHTVPAPGIG